MRRPLTIRWMLDRNRYRLKLYRNDGGKVYQSCEEAHPSCAQFRH
ncbi:MAG: hypothetical protein OXC19_20120 [Bryobacterales bacterium]|nr:hypothetical protein [Bryobacterales bacterium]